METGPFENLRIGDIDDMSLDQITDQVIARQAPEAQSIIRVLLAELAAREERLMARIVELEVAAEAEGANAVRGLKTVSEWAVLHKMHSS